MPRAPDSEYQDRHSMLVVAPNRPPLRSYANVFWCDGTPLYIWHRWGAPPDLRILRSACNHARIEGATCP